MKNLIRWLCFLGFVVGSVLGKGSDVAVSFELDNDEVVIRVENTSEESITLFDVPFGRTDYSEVPMYLMVKLRGSGNTVLSGTPVEPDGWWTPLFRVSSVLDPDRKRIPWEIGAGQDSTFRLPVMNLVSGLERYRIDFREVRSVMFQLSICASEVEDRFLVFESDWFEHPLGF